MARTYKRDSRGRFAGGGGGSSRGGGRKPLQRGTNRLTRDNAGRITSVGGDGATARGGRLRTASGRQRATVTARGIGRAPAGTVSRSGRVKAPARVKAARTAFQRTGQQRRIARPQPPRPTKEDRAIEKVKNLKAASQIGGRNKLTFVPDKALTPARRKALGLGSFATRAESQRYSVTRQMLGSQSGVAISERSAYQAQLPKPRQGVIKGGTSRKALKANAKVQAAAKPAAGSLAATRIEQSKGRASVLSQQKSALNKQLKQINAQIKEAGPNAGGLRLQKLQIQDRLNQTRRGITSAQSAARGDTASVNRPMAGARGRSLNREISRNVNAQRSAARASDKARNRQFKADQSRAKKLREVHLKPLASGYAKRSGRNEAEVRKRISAMEPKDQIKLFRQYVKENRAVARAAVARPRRR